MTPRTNKTKPTAASSATPPPDPSAQSELGSLGVGAAPPAAGASGFLGVPNGYTFQPQDTRWNPFNIFGALGAGPLPPQPVAPQYAVGSEYSIASLPTEQIARLQQAMAATGLIGAKTSFRVGIADDATIAAFKSLLSFANVNGTDVNGALNLLANHPLRQPQATTTVPNPADEDAALRDAAQQLMGHEPDPTQLEGFRPYYNALLTSQKQTADTTGSTNLADTTNTDGTPNTTGTGLDVTPLGADTSQAAIAPPSLTDAAESYLRQNDAAEIQNQKVIEMYGKLLSFIGGNGTIQ